MLVQIVLKCTRQKLHTLLVMLRTERRLRLYSFQTRTLPDFHAHGNSDRINACEYFRSAASRNGLLHIYGIVVCVLCCVWLHWIVGKYVKISACRIQYMLWPYTLPVQSVL